MFKAVQRTRHEYVNVKEMDEDEEPATPSLLLAYIFSFSFSLLCFFFPNHPAISQTFSSIPVKRVLPEMPLLRVPIRITR